MNQKIAALVPAYNEAKNIEVVLKVLGKSDILDEVLVIDDGSKDLTTSVARKAGFKVLRLEENLGKGGALQAGIKEINDAQIYLFVDADLIGLDSTHIEALVGPIRDEKDTSMTIGKFKGGRKMTDWAQSMVPQISGQRALKRSLAHSLPDISKEGFGVDILISRFAKKNNYKIKEVILENVTQVMKEEKIGLAKGFMHRLKMYGHIFRSLLKRSS